MESNDPKKTIKWINSENNKKEINNLIEVITQNSSEEKLLEFLRTLANNLSWTTWTRKTQLSTINALSPLLKKDDVVLHSSDEGLEYFRSYLWKYESIFEDDEDQNREDMKSEDYFGWKNIDADIEFTYLWKKYCTRWRTSIRPDSTMISSYSWCVPKSQADNDPDWSYDKNDWTFEEKFPVFNNLDCSVEEYTKVVLNFLATHKAKKYNFHDDK